jgi:predicted GNAT family N-acyltransferase
MSKQAYKYYFTNWKTSKVLLKSVREQVFIQEQSVPVELEWDDLDDVAHHVLVEKLDNEVKSTIATARIILNNKVAHIGRMAVLSSWRNQGIGSKMLQMCIEFCQQKNMTHIVINAQVYVISFYQKAGFDISSNEFLDAGIAHKEMTLQLRN